MDQKGKPTIDPRTTDPRTIDPRATDPRTIDPRTIYFTKMYPQIVPIYFLFKIRHMLTFTQ